MTERVAIVFPYFRTRAATEMLFPPLGAATLMGQLHQLGIEARIFDGTFSDFARITSEIRAYRPSVVGIYSMVTLSQNTFRIAEAVRAGLPEAVLVAGGPLPTLYPE